MGVRLSKVLIKGDVVSFKCPACKRNHSVDVTEGKGWKFNGNLDAPTIAPSILVHPHESSFGPAQLRCHSFVENGKIRFCSDSDHELAGKTFDLQDVEL